MGKTALILIQGDVIMKISVKKVDGVLYPIGEHSVEEANRLKNNTEYVCNIVTNRNPAFHRKAFSLLNAIFQNQDGFENFELFRAWITMKAGYVITGAAPNGVTVFMPESLAFEKMKQERFEKWFQDVITIAVREYGHDEDFLWQLFSYA